VNRISPKGKCRLALARAFVHDPQVMLFDNPTHGDDIVMVKEIHTFIKECKDNGKTVVVFSNRVSEIHRLSDRIGILIDGSMAEQGTGKEICEALEVRTLDDAFMLLYDGGNE
jgi:sodium transport system ATP-binding protein